MLKKSCILTVLLFLGFLVFNPAAWAGCKKSDIKGTWRVYGVEGQNKSYNGTVNLTITIKPDLSLKKGTRGTDPDGKTMVVTGGSVSISSTCVVAGTVKIKKPESGDRATVKLKGSLNKGKDLFTGTYEVNTTPTIAGIFTATKKWAALYRFPPSERELLSSATDLSLCYFFWAGGTFSPYSPNIEIYRAPFIFCFREEGERRGAVFSSDFAWVRF